MTSDRPYTDDDLRAEAARLHQQFTATPGESFVGEAMEGHVVRSTETGEEGAGRMWAELLEPDGVGTPEFVAAQRSVRALIEGAADVSEWAVNLGADGLEPDGHTFQLGAQGTGSNDPELPFVRMHFAFHPDATADERDRFVMELTKIIAANL